MDHCIETSDYLLFVWGHSTTCWEIPLWLWLVFVALALWHGGQKHRMVIGSCSGVVKVHFCLDIFGRKLLFNRQRIWCFGLSLLLLLHWKRAGLLYVALHRGWLCLVWGLLFWQNWLDIDEELLSCTYLSRIFDTKWLKSRQFFG